jgi:hypothetical protein
MAKDIEASGPEAGEFSAKDYTDPPPAPLIDAAELTQWSLYRAVIAEFIATLLFLYITVATVIGYNHQTDVNASGPDAACGGVGILGIAWAFGGMIFVLVYCTAGISGTVHSRAVFTHIVISYSCNPQHGCVPPPPLFGRMLTRKCTTQVGTSTPL